MTSVKAEQCETTVFAYCGFALFSFYRCHCVPLFVHAERINLCIKAFKSESETTVYALKLLNYI